MKRTSTYILSIEILKGFAYSYLYKRGRKEFKRNREGNLIIPGGCLNPKEKLDLVRADLVKVNTPVLDEDGVFNNLGQNITTDKLVSIEVRQYKVEKVFNYEGEYNTEAIIFADLVY